VEQIIAALILAVGAFFGVWKGAIYAADRLAAQIAEQRELEDRRLDAEGSRLQAQLDAEAARLERQLKHDREMRDLEEMRRTFDGISVSMRQLANMTIALQGVGELCARNPTGHSWTGLDAMREEVIGKHSGLDEDLNDRLHHLFLRLRPDDPIFEAIDSFLKTAHKMTNLYRRSCCNIGDEERSEFLALRERLSAAQADFVQRSLLLVGTYEAVGLLTARTQAAAASDS
jgi:hypothetical protein